MATIDKQSVRAEFDKIKASFDEQVKAGKVSSEVATLFNTLMMLFNLILAVFMEKRTKKTSNNSSMPPSQTTPDNSSTTNKNKPNSGKDSKANVTVAGNTRTVETVLTWRLKVNSYHAAYFTSFFLKKFLILNSLN